MAQVNFKVEQMPLALDSLHINQIKKRVRGRFNVLGFVDPQTKQHVAYVPALEVSGYGDNKQEAMFMVEEMLTSMFETFVNMSPLELNAELERYGWKRSKFFAKEFSAKLVDFDAKMKELNVEVSKIERFQLVA